MKRFFPDDDEESDSNAAQPEDRRGSRGTAEAVQRRRSEGDPDHQQAWNTPSPDYDHNKEAEVQQERDRRRYTPASRDYVPPEDDRNFQRRDDMDTSTPIERQSISRGRTYEDVSRPDRPRDRHPSSINGDAYPNGREPREDEARSSQQPGLPSRRDSTVPSPAQPVEDIPSTELATYVPKDEVYSIVSQVGEGTFGKVYKARNNVTGVHVALKRIRMETERDGFPVTAMREIKLLQSLRHVNIVQLSEMMVHNGALFFCFVIRRTTIKSVQVRCTWSLSTWTTILQVSYRKRNSHSRLHT